MSEPKRLSVGGMDLPVDIDGLEALPSTGGVMQFDFTYRGIHFAAKCEDGDAGAHVKVVGDIGRMPYTAEAPAARAGLSHILMHANGLIGRVFRLVGERILVGGEADMETPITATRLLSAMAVILIPVTPYLDLMSVYFEPGGDKLKPEWRIKSRVPAPTPLRLGPP